MKEKDAALALYQEAWERHVNTCDQCDLISMSFCHTGNTLRDAYCQRAAQLLAPIPTIPAIPRSRFKA